VLAAGWGLAGLVWKNAATALLAGLAYRAVLRRQAPELARARPRLDRRQVRALLTFGRHVQAVNLGSALVEPVCKVLMARVAGLEAVALYELAHRVAAQLGAVFVALATAVFPAAAERAGDDRDLTALHRAAARYVAWLALPGYGVFLVLAGRFTAAWLGPGYDEVGRAMAVLGAGWLVAILALPAFLVSQAGGRERLSTASAAVTVGVALGLAALLVGPAGMIGVAAAVALGLAAGGVVTGILFARTHRLGRAVLDVGGPVPVAAALAGAAAARATAAVLPAHLAGVALAGGAGLVVAAALMWLGGAVGPAERALLAGLVRRP
jgi:O-antigen/teichoic acid export membrane protein